MSYSFSISCRSDALPDSVAWNRELALAGFDLEVAQVDWAKQSGFLPAKLLGIPTGFELSASLSDDGANIEANLHSSRLELAVASAALAVLQKCTGGEYGDDDGRNLSVDESMNEAKSTYRGVRVILGYLRSNGELLPVDVPPLDPGESLKDRTDVLDALVRERTLVSEVVDGVTRYRLHKLRGEQLRVEMQGVS